jgi:hypothetical protein
MADMNEVPKLINENSDVLCGEHLPAASATPGMPSSFDPALLRPREPSDARGAEFWAGWLSGALFMHAAAAFDVRPYPPTTEEPRTFEIADGRRFYRVTVVEEVEDDDNDDDEEDQ